MSKRIFITGGAGYIGSHACVELLRANHEVMVFDNLSNSSEEAIRRVELLTNRKLGLVIGDIRNIDVLNDAMCTFKPDSVIHFAGLKSVEQSVLNPLLYYDVNVHGSINLLNVMANTGCHEVVFSSSATVYGEANKPPYTEMMPVSPVSPYGRTKLIFENILQDWVNANDVHRAVVLRYFNPVGAHMSGLIGEDPQDTPNNLMPLISRVAQKKQNYLSVYGTDYVTRDGTGERDYIHVLDLAMGHLNAIQNINNLQRFQILNLGTGRSTTVRELIDTFEQSNNISIPIRLAERRLGDVAKSYADPTLARKLIGFECKRTLETMCMDYWNWIHKNPDGYR
jgi:UDP-glucose 4-epimerase